MVMDRNLDYDVSDKLNYVHMSVLFGSCGETISAYHHSFIYAWIFTKIESQLYEYI